MGARRVSKRQQKLNKRVIELKDAETQNEASKRDRYDAE